MSSRVSQRSLLTCRRLNRRSAKPWFVFLRGGEGAQQQKQQQESRQRAFSMSGLHTFKTRARLPRSPHPIQQAVHTTHTCGSCSRCCAAQSNCCPPPLPLRTPPPTPFPSTPPNPPTTHTRHTHTCGSCRCSAANPTAVSRLFSCFLPPKTLSCPPPQHNTHTHTTHSPVGRAAGAVQQSPHCRPPPPALLPF